MGFAKGVDPQGRPSSRRSSFVKSRRVLSSDVKRCQGFLWANRLISMACDASRAILAARQVFASPRLVVGRPLAPAPRGRPLHDPLPPHEPIPAHAAGLEGKRGGRFRHGARLSGGAAGVRWMVGNRMRMLAEVSLFRKNLLQKVSAFRQAGPCVEHDRSWVPNHGGNFGSCACHRRARRQGRAASRIAHANLDRCARRWPLGLQVSLLNESGPQAAFRQQRNLKAPCYAAAAQSPRSGRSGGAAQPLDGDGAAWPVQLWEMSDMVAVLEAWEATKS